MSVQTRLALKPRPYTSRCVNEYIAGLKKDVSEGWHRVVSDRAMNHDVGNLLNAIVFGRTYDKGDEAWNAIQRAREDGIKILGVASGLQFLPWLSWLQAKTERALASGQRVTMDEYKRCTEAAESRLEEWEGEEKEPTDLTEALLIAAKKNVAGGKEKTINMGWKTDRLHHVFHVQADVFGAGVDTALNTLRWAILVACKYPSQQRLLREEIDLALRPDDAAKAVGMEHYDQLHYTRAFILETMRMFYVVPCGVPHGTTRRGAKLESWTLPKDCLIIPLNYHIMNDEDLWHRPEEFNPRRFIGADGRVETPDHFLPFQTGRRRCIGEDLGLSMVFLMLANLVREFNLTLESDYDLFQHGHEHGFTLAPRSYKLYLEDRR